MTRAITSLTGIKPARRSPRWNPSGGHRAGAVFDTAQMGHARGPILRTTSSPQRELVAVGSKTVVGLKEIRKNGLLAALPADVLARWSSLLERIELPLGKVLYESGGQMSHVVFPTTAIVSLIYILESGASAEIAVAGREGLVGISLFMGGNTTPSQAVVQSAGEGLRVPAAFLMSEFNGNAQVMHLLLRYTQALITQMSQTAVCNRHHSLDQQLCRWLLLSLDRLPSNELTMTQELIAHMLGVRREGVNEAAGRLAREGLITYRRGRIRVLDRAGLEQRVCECYAVVKKEYDRLLPAPPAAGSPLIGTS